jgi:hypothetical protein
MRQDQAKDIYRGQTLFYMGSTNYATQVKVRRVRILGNYILVQSTNSVYYPLSELTTNI